MGIKDLILKKGWAGKTITRAETVERLNPILQRLSAVLALHNSDGSSAGSDQVKTLRMDIGKISESIVSCGGIAERAPLPADEAGTDVQAAEKGLIDALKAENDIEHQMRTRAVLSAVLANTENRLRQMGNA